jgi:hypothetical protein
MKLLLAFFVLMTAQAMSLASPAAAMGADVHQATKAGAGDAASTSKPPMVIHNPDGTFTVQKAPPKDGGEDTKANRGLIIPPQVVVPIIPPRETRK